MKIMQKLVWLLVFFVLLCGGFVACILGANRWQGIVPLFAEAQPLEIWVGVGTLALALLFALTNVAGRGTTVARRSPVPGCPFRCPRTRWRRS